MARRLNVLDLLALTAKIRVSLKDKLKYKNVYDKVELMQGKEGTSRVFYLLNSDNERISGNEGLSLSEMHTYLSGMLCAVELMVKG